MAIALGAFPALGAPLPAGPPGPPTAGMAAVQCRPLATTQESATLRVLELA
jgi:hypothetical protein